MILTCPQCATRYQVEADKFPASGRNVRCSKCGHVWHQLGPMPDPDTEIESREPNASANSDAESPHTNMAAAAPLRPLRPAADETDSDTTRGSLLGRVAIASGWLLLVALVLAIGWTAVVMRDS